MTGKNPTFFDRELEKFRAKMKWSPQASDLEQTLVNGNLNGFVAHLNSSLSEYAVVPIKMTDAMLERSRYLADGPSQSHEEIWAELLDAALVQDQPVNP
jgi:hypothetical protein